MILLFFFGAMHPKTTEFSAQMLAHTKQLIKQLDEAKFPYNRQEIMTMLHTFVATHNKKHEAGTVDQLQALLDRTELLEHQYQEWVAEHTQKTSIDEMKSLLGGFHKKTVATVAQEQQTTLPRTGTQQWIETLGSVQDYLIILMCVALCTTLIFGGTTYMWYFLIIMALFTLVIFYAKRIVTKRGRVFAIVSLIGGWMVFLS